MKKFYFFFVFCLFFGNIAFAQTARFFNFDDPDTTVQEEFINSEEVSPGLNGSLFFTNYTQTPDGKLTIHIDDEGNNGEIIASEIALLDGTLNVKFSEGNYKTSSVYRIIHADIGVAGQFNRVLLSHIGLGQLIYEAEDVFLKFIHFDALELHGNAKHAAKSFLCSSITHPDVALVNETLLSFDHEKLQHAFKQIEPSFYSALSQVEFTNITLLRSSITNHLDSLSWDSCSSDFTIWADSNNQWQNQQSNGHQRGYKAFSTVASIGIDYFQNNTVLGAIGSYSYSDIDGHHAAGHGNINSYYGGVYGLWQRNCFFVDFAALGAHNSYETERNICFGKIRRHPHAHHSGSEALAEIGAGKQGCFQNYMWEAFGRFDYVLIVQDAFRENKAKSLSLRVDKNRDHFLNSELGISIYRSFQWQCGLWTPEITLGYINQSCLNKNRVKAQFKKSDRSFSVDSRFERNLFAPGFELTYLSLCENVSLVLEYTANIGSGYWSQAADLQAGIKF